MDYLRHLLDDHLGLAFSKISLDLEILGQSIALTVIQNNTDSGLEFNDFDESHNIWMMQLLVDFILSLDVLQVFMLISAALKEMFD
jgi:hypothetical protein